MKEREVFKNTSRIREERYNYAVEVAAGLFLEKGIEEVKMTDIAENCGIGVASLYRFFETKTEIVLRAGSILWQKVNKDFLKYVQNSDATDGLSLLIYDLKYFKKLFVRNKEFIKFLDDFDRLMLDEKMPPEHLADYEKSIVNFYEPFNTAYEMGIKDGTIRKIDDLHLVYSTITHSLMAISQKFIRGAILPGDDKTQTDKEIEKLLEMTAKFLAA